MIKKIKFYWHGGTAPVFVIGAFLFLISIAIFVKGNSPGFLWKATGLEACLKAICLLLLSCVLLSKPFFESKDRDWSIKEVVFFVGAGISCELIPHFVIAILKQ